MSVESQDIINQVSLTNSRTVELLNLLAKSNTLLIEYVLVREVEASTTNGRRGHVEVNAPQKLLPAAATATNGNGHHPQLEAAPEPEVTAPRRGRPRADDTLTASERKHNRDKRHAPGYTVVRGTQNAWVTDFAQAHGGIIDFALFREDFQKRKRKPITFIQTTMHGVCRKLVGDGIMERIDATHYKLIDPSRVPPLDNKGVSEPATAQSTAKRPASGRYIPLAHQGKIVDFAKQHGGTFSVQAARAAWAHEGDIPPTYCKTTIFNDLANLARRGVLKKAGPGAYKLTGK